MSEMERTPTVQTLIKGGDVHANQYKQPLPDAYLEQRTRSHQKVRDASQRPLCWSLNRRRKVGASNLSLLTLRGGADGWVYIPSLVLVIYTIRLSAMSWHNGKYKSALSEFRTAVGSRKRPLGSRNDRWIEGHPMCKVA